MCHPNEMQYYLYQMGPNSFNVCGGYILLQAPHGFKFWSIQGDLFSSLLEII